MAIQYHLQLFKSFIFLLTYLASTCTIKELNSFSRTNQWQEGNLFKLFWWTNDKANFSKHEERFFFSYMNLFELQKNSLGTFNEFVGLNPTQRDCRKSISYGSGDVKGWKTAVSRTWKSLWPVIILALEQEASTGKITCITLQFFQRFRKSTWHSINKGQWQVKNPTLFEVPMSP